MGLEQFFQNLLIQPKLDALGCVIRLLLALVCGGLVGLERGRHNQAAGFRTHMMIALASCIIMEAGILMFETYGGITDPTRMAAQVVSGMGFLGAGAIFRFGFDVKGLTTASSLWAVSSLGLGAGAGLYFLTVAGTFLGLLVLRVLEPFSHRITPHQVIYTLQLKGRDTSRTLEDLKFLCEDLKIKIEKISLTRKVSSGQSALSCQITTLPGFDANIFVERVSTFKGIESTKLEALS